MNNNRFKFRVWHFETHRFLGDNGDFTYAKCGIDYEFREVATRPDRFIVQQWTGLKDKDGQDIYEGDIIEVYSHRHYDIEAIHGDKYGQIIPEKDGKPMAQFVGSVIFKDHSFKINVKGYTNFVWYKPYIDGAAYSSSIKVVGNIFENPELAKNALGEQKTTVVI